MRGFKIPSLCEGNTTKSMSSEGYRGVLLPLLTDDCNLRLVPRKIAFISPKSLTKLTAFFFDIQSQNARVDNERYHTEYIEHNLLFNLSCHVTQRTDCLISQYIVTTRHSTGMLKLLLLL